MMTAIQTTSPSGPPPWVRVSEVKRYFGVHKSTVYRAAGRGEIRIYKNRGSRVKSSEMEKWLSGEA